MGFRKRDRGQYYVSYDQPGLTMEKAFNERDTLKRRFA